MSFVYSQSVDASKIFLASKSDLLTRWDPFFYRPELVALERRVLSATPYRLRDFAVRMTGGATPPTRDAETHYTEGAEGVPFIRVQNLSTTGILNLEGCKQITRSTHDGLLARSRLTGGELLVKITGVGRMAVASVVPQDFEGNINQHIVAIRTRDAACSETLAAYLNLDVAEKLASRRSTGGTRPALDYPALLSIPVIFDERIPTMLRAAVVEYEERRAKAKSLIAQIDDVLLGELGIDLKSTPPDTLDGRIFRRPFSEVTGDRFDAFFHAPNFAEFEKELRKDNRYTQLRELGYLVRGVTYTSEDEREDGITILRANNVDLETGELLLDDLVHIRSDFKFNLRQKIQPNDILICAASGSKAHAGKVCFITSDVNAYFGGFMMVLRNSSALSIPEYIAYYMQSGLFRKTLYRHLGGTNINNISMSLVNRLGVTVPKLQHQQEICEQIRDIREQAKKLRLQASDEYGKAAKNIESLILSEGKSE